MIFFILNLFFDLSSLNFWISLSKKIKIKDKLDFHLLINNYKYYYILNLFSSLSIQLIPLIPFFPYISFLLDPLAVTIKISDKINYHPFSSDINSEISKNFW